METTLADERVLLFQAQLSIDQAEGRAWSKKIDAFGRVVKMTSIVQRPKDSDFQLIYKEHRYQPFWHIICSARYVYDRQRDFHLALNEPDVESVTIDGRDYPVSNGRIKLTGVEHCREEPRQELYIDGLTGEIDPLLANYLNYAANEIPREQVESFAPAGVIVVPPQARSSAIVREALLGIIKHVQADLILEDRVDVEQVDLYYRPVYAFQYRWLSRGKEAVMELDGLTGQLVADGKTFQQYVGKILDTNFLFDVGIDTIDLFVPGGGLAMKIARKGIDVARSRSKE